MTVVDQQGFSGSGVTDTAGWHTHAGLLGWPTIEAAMTPASVSTPCVNPSAAATNVGSKSPVRSLVAVTTHEDAARAMDELEQHNNALWLRHDLTRATVASASEPDSVEGLTAKDIVRFYGW